MKYFDAEFTSKPVDDNLEQTARAAALAADTAEEPAGFVFQNMPIIQISDAVATTPLQSPMKSPAKAANTSPGSVASASPPSPTQSSATAALTSLAGSPPGASSIYVPTSKTSLRINQDDYSEADYDTEELGTQAVAQPLGTPSPSTDDFLGFSYDGDLDNFLQNLPARRAYRCTFFSFLVIFFETNFLVSQLQCVPIGVKPDCTAHQGRGWKWRRRKQ